MHCLPRWFICPTLEDSHRHSLFCAFHDKIDNEGYPDGRHQRYNRPFRRVINLCGSWLNATETLSRLSENGANMTVSRIAATPLPPSLDHHRMRLWRLRCNAGGGPRLHTSAMLSSPRNPSSTIWIF